MHHNPFINRLFDLFGFLQVGELGANVLSPFQRLGEDISSRLTGGLDSLKTGAQGAVTENIGSPLQARELVA